MGRGDHASEDILLFLRERPASPPAERLLPVRADPGDQVRRLVRPEIRKPSVESHVSDPAVSDGGAGLVPRDDDEDGTVRDRAAVGPGEHVGVRLEHCAKRLVRRPRLRFHVHEEAALGPACVSPPTVRANARPQRVEVETLERPIRVDILPVVCDEEPPVHEPDVRLEAAETMGEGVEQGSAVLEVVVGVRVGQRDWDAGRASSRAPRGVQPVPAATTTPARRMRARGALVRRGLELIDRKVGGSGTAVTSSWAVGGLQKAPGAAGGRSPPPSSLSGTRFGAVGSARPVHQALVWCPPPHAVTR